MITTPKKARMTKCIEDRKEFCIAHHCMAWEYYVDNKCIRREEMPHGISDEQKLGYCGLSKRR